MKKNIIIAAISVASVILLAASCQKQEEPEIKNESKTFTAVIDQELTKTTITNEYKVNWNEGDQIDINAGTTYSATPNTSDATKATFTKVSGSDPDGEYGYTAVYPASLFKNSGYELPTTQTYATGKFNAPMCAMSDTESLEFKNFCGVLCFALKGTDKVRSIAVTANEQLCGPFEFMDATAICFTGENEGYTITLDCGTEGIQLDETTATNFYIYLPACTYTAGMKMTVTNTDGETFEKTTTKSAEIVRSNIYSFNWTLSFAPVIPAGALSGKFTINENGDQVYFSKGNLWYDNSTEPDGPRFKIEYNQYDYKVGVQHSDSDGISYWDWDKNHISHFYWSKNTYTAYAQTYTEMGSTNDVFFSNETPTTARPDFTVNVDEEGQTGVWRVLSGGPNGEWQYLLEERKMKYGKARYTNGPSGQRIGIQLYYGLFIYPDDYNGAEIGKGGPETWEGIDAAGIVFLPATGARGGDNPGDRVYFVNDHYGAYWSGTPDSDNQSKAYCLCFSTYPYFDVSSIDFRGDGISVRLVRDVK